MAAGRHGGAVTASLTLPVTIRPAYADDEPDLWRLAALDSAAMPRHPLLVAESDGLLAAVSLADLAAIADPFRPTAAVVDLLRHAASTIETWPRQTTRRRASTSSPAPRRARWFWVRSPRFSSARP